jgi:predicted PurR-regulated permease PerM
MPKNNRTLGDSLSTGLTEALIRFGIIVFLVFLTVRIFAPFTNMLLLGLIFAIALYPWQRALARRMGGRRGLAATVLVVSGLLLLGVPTGLLGGSLAGQAHDGYAAIQTGDFTLLTPDPAVAEWPLVGERLYDTWSRAAKDLPAYLQDNRTQIRDLSLRVLSVAGSAVMAVLLFLGSMIVAGIMMTYGESGSAAIGRIFTRLSDAEHGPRLQNLATAAVRSVAAGVVGVAFIQALLLGVGFILAGVPAPGLLSLIVVFIGILQLPAVLISIPVIAYLWTGDGSTAVNVALTVYLLVAGMSDNVLKPLLLGRGVETPMVVILLGAIGGMIVSGIVGLFIGPVVLAVSYEVFIEWVDGPRSRATTAAAPEPERVPLATTEA